MNKKKGLFLCLLVLFSLLSLACNLTHLLAPAATPTPTATDTPTATLTPIPTITPTETQLSSTFAPCEDGQRYFTATIPMIDSQSSIDGSCTDSWAITAKAGTNLLISMTLVSGNLSPDFSLWTAASDSCTNCADMTSVGFSTDTNTQATLSLTIPYTGDYYLIVMPLDESTSGTYTMSIVSTGYTPVATPTRVAIPTKVYVYPTATQANVPNLGTVPVTFTNNTSHRMKIVAVGPLSYSFFIDGGVTLDLSWAPGTYDVTAYYEDGTYYASTSYAVNENHAIFTLN